MGVWEYGRVGVWECGVWEYGRVGVWEYGRVGVWACGRVGVWEYGRGSDGARRRMAGIRDSGWWKCENGFGGDGPIASRLVVRTRLDPMMFMLAYGGTEP
jgi:hypothetical protein